MAKSRSTGLNILITGDAKGASAAFNKLGKDVDSIEGRTRKLTDGIGTLIKAYAGFSFGKSIIDEAASLAEAQNTAGVVFAESAESVREFGTEAAEAFGISERAALQAANGYGLLLTNMGVGQEQAAEWSTTLAALASDLAAFADLPLDQALGAIRSGLSGESEPLKAFGVRLTEAKVKQEALTLGLYDGTGAIDDYARAVATFNIIMEDTATAQGTYARESDGLKQQTQALTAEWDNAKAKLGAELIPAMQWATSAAGALLGVWSALPGEVQTGVVALGLVALAGPKIVAGFKGASDALTNFRLGLMGVTQQGAGASNAVGGFVNRIGGMSSVLGVGAIAAVGFGAALYAWQDEANKAAREAAALKAAIDTLRSSAEAAGHTIEEEFIASNLVDLWADARDELIAYGLTLDMLRRGLTGTDEEFAAMLQGAFGSIDSVQEAALIKQLNDQRQALVGAKEATEAASEAKDELGLADDEAAAAADRNTSAIRRQKSQLDILNDSMKERLDRVEQQWNLEEGLRDAQESRADAEAELAEAQRAAIGQSEEYRDATRGVADAQEALGDAQRGVADAQERVNEARAAAVERLEEMRRSVEDLRQSERRARMDAALAREDALQARNDPRLTALERADAQLKATEAEEAAAESTRDRRDAESELAAARRRGIEGDQAVIDAKRGVADAEDRVREAADRVTEAQRRQAEVITAAKDRVKEASDRVKDATLEEAAAWGELVTAQSGANAGVLAHIAALDALLGRIGEGSPLAEALRARRDDLMGITFGGRVAAGEMSLAAAEIEMRALDGGRRGGSNITVNNYGTPEQVRRATRDSIDGHLRKYATGAR